MKRTDLKVGDIVVVETAWLKRPTCHHIVTEVMGEKYLVSFYGDVNCSDRPVGFYTMEDGELPDGTILVARPKHPHFVFSRKYLEKPLYGEEPYFEILYKREDAELYLD